MQRARWCNQLLCAAILCIVLGTILGCSPERRYKVLSFFFDGVPVPKGVNAPGQRQVYQHKPYTDGKCGACHESDQVEMDISRPTNIVRPASSKCLNCHQKVQTEHRVTHGPVASGQCLLCHGPHSSTLKYLLAAPSPQLCQQCHVPEMLSAKRPEHRDGKADCLSCHSGHGGDTRDLLRPKGAATTQPTVAKPAVPEGISSAPPAVKGAGL